jgi:hypothetical protein
MNCLIAVLRDRIQAEAAYVALEQEQIPTSQIQILGKGYKTADDYGLVNPSEKAWSQVRLMGLWLVPFGFVAGFAFSVLSHLETFAWAGTVGNHVIGGLLGAGGGAMGSFFVGGGLGLAFSSGDALPYRNRLNAGQYLVAVRGTEVDIQRSAQVLRQFEPEMLRNYMI